MARIHIYTQPAGKWKASMKTSIRELGDSKTAQKQYLSCNKWYCLLAILNWLSISEFSATATPFFHLLPTLKCLFDQPLREKLQQKLPRSSYMSGSPWPSEWNEIFDQSQLQPGNTPMKSVSQRLSQRDLEEAIPKIGGF